jgi:hypothetical protein
LPVLTMPPNPKLLPRIRNSVASGTGIRRMRRDR